MEIDNMTSEERKALMEKLKSAEKAEKKDRREAYEALRAEFMQEVQRKLEPMTVDVQAFRQWIEGESEAFNAIMRQYGQLRKTDQESYTVIDGDFKVEVKSNKVKSFDERADIAAERLINYLKRYVQGRDKGVDDPMYQLAMTLLERNKAGDLDYKSISKLYELENRFDGEYSEIMDLFRESNIVQKNAINYYFHKRDKNGVWRRIEPSFCRL